MNWFKGWDRRRNIEEVEKWSLTFDFWDCKKIKEKVGKIEV